MLCRPVIFEKYFQVHNKVSCNQSQNDISMFPLTLDYAGLPQAKSLQIRKSATSKFSSPLMNVTKLGTPVQTCQAFQCSSVSDYTSALPKNSVSLASLWATYF